MTDLLRISYKLIRPIYNRTSFHRSVVDEVEDPGLRKAYTMCRNITRHYAKTFYMATRFLPNRKQRGIFAIYGLCRYLDNLVDEAEDLISQKKLESGDIKRRLEEWKMKLKHTYEGKRCENPILIALADVLRTHDIPIELPYQLVEGVGMDLYKNRYETFQEVYDYSYKVASTVGLMTSEVFGYASGEALKFAVDLGIAMQYTNILRDVGEDLQQNRIYLPMEDLDHFSIREGDLFSHTLDEKFIHMMKFQINRNRSFYRKADQGVPLLAADSRLPVYMARYNYSRILDKIEENSYNVFSLRAHLNYTEKLAILPRIFFRMIFSHPNQKRSN